MHLGRILLIFAFATAAQYEKDFSESFFHANHFGEVQSMFAFDEKSLVLIGPTGFARVDAKGKLLYNVHEYIENFTIEGEELTMITQNGKKVYVFELRTGNLVRDVKIETSRVLDVVVYRGTVWLLTPLRLTSVRSDLTFFSWGEEEALSVIVKNETLRVIVQRQLQFCEIELGTEIVTECLEEKSLKVLPATQSSLGCLHAVNDLSFELCWEGKAHAELRREGASALEIVLPDLKEEKPTQLLIDIIGQVGYVLTDCLTLFSWSLSTGAAGYKREESLGSVVSSVLLQKEEAMLNEFESYAQAIEQGPWVAWRKRMEIQIKAVLKALTRLPPLFMENWDNSKSFLGHSRTLLRSQRKLILLTRPGKIHLFDLETQIFTSSALLPSRNTQGAEILQLSLSTAQISLQKESFIINDRLQIIHKPAHISLLTQCIVDKNKGRIELMEGDKIQWSLVFPPTEQILDLYSAKEGSIPQKIFVIEGNYVIYKFSDINNVMVVTKSLKVHNVYILNMSSGRVLASISNKQIMSSVTALVDDNTFLLSYTSRDTLKSELWVIELFQRRVEKSFKGMAAMIFNSNVADDLVVNYNKESPCFVLQKKYMIDLDIRYIVAFSSSASLTSRDFIVSTSNADLYALPRNLISSRRQEEEKEKRVEVIDDTDANILTSFIKSSSLPVYHYELEITPSMCINKKKSLTYIDSVKFYHSDFESTSFIVATGKDIFLGMVSPNGTFDRLPQDFNKPILCLVFIGCMIALLFSEIYLRRKMPYFKYKLIA